jgi:predicted dehydrogenase
MKVGIIGFGRMGQRRANAMAGAELVAIAEDGDGWGRVLNRKDIDIVVVSTPHDLLARATSTALRLGKHVLVEKPAGVTSSELEKVRAIAKRERRLVRVGFNHRYHRAFRKAFEVVDQIGPIMYVRGRYGHSGRPGYDREWRSHAVRGGGELLDQGCHLIDLARCFLGEFPTVAGHGQTCYWDMEVEDNGFMLLRNKGGQTAFLHVSCTEWGKIFSFEVFGQKGKIEVSGLISCGPERLSLHRIDTGEKTVWEFPSDDDSFGYEMAEFLKDIKAGREPSPGLTDAIAALRVIERVKEGST